MLFIELDSIVKFIDAHIKLLNVLKSSFLSAHILSYMHLNSIFFEILFYKFIFLFFRFQGSVIALLLGANVFDFFYLFSLYIPYTLIKSTFSKFDI